MDFCSRCQRVSHLLFVYQRRDTASLAKTMSRFGVLCPLRHRCIDMGMNALTHAVFSQLCTSYNSLSGFETWSVGCLVTAARFFVFFFSEEQSYSTPPLPFILPLNELLFTPFNLRALNDRRMQAREGGRGENTHTDTLSRCSYRAPTVVLLKINRGKGSGIASQFFFFALGRGARYQRKIHGQRTGQRWNCQKKLWKESLNHLLTLSANIVGNTTRLLSDWPSLKAAVPGSYKNSLKVYMWPKDGAKRAPGAKTDNNG